MDIPLEERAEEGAANERPADDHFSEAQETQKPNDGMELLIPPVPLEADAVVKTEQLDALSVPNGTSAGGESHDEQQVAESPRHIWLPGTHVLLNARSGTAIDLCGADQRNLIGFPVHMGPNQQVRC